MTEGQRIPPDIPPPPEPPAAPRRKRRWLAAAIIAYTLAIIVLWLWMRTQGDRTWLATVFLFGPRWICALPLLVLVPLAAIWQRRSLVLLAVALIAVMFGICGLELHFSSADAPYRVRILTCNVNQLQYPLEDLSQLIAELNPDIVALQEVPFRPPQINWPPDWKAVQYDKFILASRHPLEVRDRVNRPTQVVKPLAVRVLVDLPSGQIQLFNLHLTTPRPGLQAVLDGKRGWDLSGVPKLEQNLQLRATESRVTSEWVESFPGPKFVVGDFNAPPEGAVFRDSWSDFRSAYSTAGFGFGYTKLTGRGRLPYGTRIDHILYTPPWRCVRAWVTRDIGSDHLPLVADFE